MLTPIETKYKGYRFRSRLEARWAVFFDLLGMQWEYEPEGFKLPSGAAYLPDFRVYTPQGQSIWYEVKPGSVKTYDKFEEFKRCLDSSEDDKFEEFKRCLDSSEDDRPSSARATILSGDPMDAVKMEKSSYGSYVTNICPRCGIIGGIVYGGEGELPFFECEPCDYETPSGSGNDAERGIVGIEVTPRKGAEYVDDLNVERFARAVIKATQAARSARFEHGENG